MVLIVASVHKIYHFQFLHICCALSVRGTYLTPISLCRTIFPSLSLSICSSHWSPWVGPTGINSLPPGLSCFMRASGMGWAAAPTCIASYGASIKFTKVIFKTWIGWKNENVILCSKTAKLWWHKKETSKKGPFLVLWEPLLGTFCTVWTYCSVYLQSTVITPLVISQLSETPRNYPTMVCKMKGHKYLLYVDWMQNTRCNKPNISKFSELSEHWKMVSELKCTIYPTSMLWPGKIFQ